MKLDFSAFGAPGGGGQSPRGTGVRLPRGLLQRHMRERLDVRALDDARGPVRTGLIATILFFGLFLLVALVAPISGAAIAPGEVATSGDRMLVQPVTGGIVSEVLVREGQPVRAGQPLVRLNGVRSGAQLQQAQARRDALRALEARLIAERDGNPQLTFPADLVARGGMPGARDVMQAQMAIFDRHRGILEADRSVTETRLLAAQARRLASQRQLALINDELSGVAALYSRGFARKSTLRALQRSAAQLESDVATGGAEIREAQINRQRTRDAQLMAIVTELGRVQEQLAQVNPQLEVSRYLADQDVMRAVVGGRVSGLAQVGRGTVVSGGTTLMEIVPTTRTLIVEARIRPEDIDDVTLGAGATVRFTTVNPHGQSAFEGKVVTLSPNRIEAKQGGGYYRAQIAIDDKAALARAGVTLQPGVPASVNVATERRTLWSYLMSPLRDALSRTFREE